MLICKNCNTNNEIGTTSCKKCNMKGMLIQDNTIPISNQKRKTQKISCKNCGTDEPGEASKCQHCSFPISRNETIKIDSKQSITN